VTKIQIVAESSGEQHLPIQLKEHGVDFLLDHRHLCIERRAGGDSADSRGAFRAREYYGGQGYTLTDAPMFDAGGVRGNLDSFSK